MTDTILFETSRRELVDKALELEGGLPALLADVRKSLTAQYIALSPVYIEKILEETQRLNALCQSMDMSEQIEATNRAYQERHNHGHRT